MTTLQTITAGTGADTRVNENFEQTSPAALYAKNPVTSSGLVWGYKGGQYNGVAVADGTLTLTASVTNYIVANRTTGVVSAAATTTNWNDTAGYLCLHSVLAGSATVTSYTDMRQAIGGQSSSGSGASWGAITGLLADQTDLASALAAKQDTSGLPEVIDDRVAGLLVAGANITLVYNDVANTLTIAAAGGGGGMTNPMTAGGDMIVGGSSGTPARLAAGTTGYVLTIVSGAPAWAAPSGGGGLTGFAASLLTASPNNTVNVSLMLASGGSTDQDAAFSPKGAGALVAQAPDGAASGGNKRGTNAVDFQMRRASADQVASGDYSFLGNGYNNKLSGANGGLIAGRDNTLTAVLGFLGAGFNNVNSGAAGFLGAGGNNNLSGPYSFIGAGSGNNVSVDYAGIVAGSANSVTGLQGFIGGGQSNLASGARSFIPGGTDGTTRGLSSSSAHASGRFSVQGDAQKCEFVQMISTTSATATRMGADSSVAVADSIVLPNFSMYGFEAMISARNNAAGTGAVLKIIGAIERLANAATTAVVGTPTVTVIGAKGAASAWSVAAVANTTDGALTFVVTGAASESIKWVAHIRTVEVVG